MAAEPIDPAARFGDLASLLPLTGRWRVEGEDVSGEASFAWAPGRRFLTQVFDLRRDGRWLDGIEIIGGQGEAIVSRVHLFREGRTLDLVYELEDGKLTVWLGARGAEARLTARFDADGRRLTGEWHTAEGAGAFEAVKID